MKSYQKAITLHLRPSKKAYYLLEYEIRNYVSDGQILRIPAYYNNEKLKLKKNQLNKGLIVNHTDSYRLNYYFNNEKIKIEYIIKYLILNKIEVTTKAIKHYLYNSYKDVEYYFTEVEDFEDHLKVNDSFYLDKLNDEALKHVSTPKHLIYDSKEVEQKADKENYETIQKDEIKKLEQTDLQYIFEENLWSDKSKYNQYNRVANTIKYYKKVNNIKYLHYSEYSYNLIDKLIRFAISNGYEKGDKKDYYKVSVIKKLSNFFIEFGRWLTANGYEINPNYRDFKLIIGSKKDAHIKYKFNDKYNVVVINSVEFQTIKDFNFASVKDKGSVSSTLSFSPRGVPPWGKNFS